MEPEYEAFESHPTSPNRPSRSVGHDTEQSGLRGISSAEPKYAHMAHMANDIKEEVHELSRKMAEEKDPEKLALLKQQLRQLLLESDGDSKEETPSEDASK